MRTARWADRNILSKVAGHWEKMMRLGF